MIQVLAVRGALLALWHFAKDAVIAGVAQGVTNVIAARVEDAHDRHFQIGDYAPDHTITFEVDEPCEPGCTCDACKESGEDAPTS